MGTVYAAADPDLARNVAIKILHDFRGKASRSETLLREAQAMARFSHPNVVTVHDVGTHEGRLFVAMDWVRGPTLRTWMKGRAWDVVLRAFLQAGRGLAAVHEAGLVHRDFKPANVMLHPGGRVVVMDFGLARVSDHSEPQPAAALSELTDDDALSRLGSVQGTPAYMAPEQHLAFDVDERADQFSYCVSVFEGLYGKRPYRARTVTELIMRISNGEFVDLPRTQVPKRIHRALVRGLAELPNDRWPSMEALLDRLQPASPRTWVAWSAGAAALATVGFAAVPPTDPCETRGDAVRDLWSPPQRAAVQESLQSSPEPFAEETSAKVDATLDAYVEQLADAHDRACQTEVEPTLLDRRTACLRQRAGSLRATLDALSSPTGNGPSRAMKVLGQLPPVDACLDPDALAEESELPADEAQRAQIASARNAISEARALEHAGDLEAAHARAKAALVLARDCRYHPVEAEALAAWGSTQDARGEYAAAVDSFEAAFHLARANHHDRTALRAAVELVYIVGYRLQQPDAADGWLRNAQSLFTHVQGDFARMWEARLINNEATLAYSAGDYEGAASGFEKTAEIREALHGPDHDNVAAAHSNLGLALTRLGKLDQALEHHARARSGWEASLGPSHPMVAISVHNRAYVLETMERYGEAAREYEKAIELRKRSQGPTHPSVGLSLNNLGHVRTKQKRPLDALSLHQEALAIWHDAYGPDHRRVAEALSGIAEALSAQGRLEESHRFADRAISTLERVVGVDHPDYGESLWVLAEIQVAEGDIAGARSNLERARAVFVEAWGDAHERISSVDRQLANLSGKG
jgi:tetratricopeptide (TPR) repeat protein